MAVAQTAEKRGVYFIGHNADLSKFAPKMHLAGTLWLWSGLYTKVAEDILNNQWKGGIDYNGGLDKGYVGITDFNPVVPQEVRDEVLNAKEMIASGKLAVYRGPIKDNKGKLRVKEGETLTHEQIMAMDWMVEGIK